MKQQHVNFKKPVEPDEQTVSVCDAVRSQSILEKNNAIEFNPTMKCFLVRGTGNVVRLVKFTPKPTCSCRPVRTCYHIQAVQRSIGVWKSSTKKTINLTQLRRNKRTLKQRPGRKRPRIGDCDVTAAPDADGLVDVPIADDNVNPAPDADCNIHTDVVTDSDSAVAGTLSDSNVQTRTGTDNSAVTDLGKDEATVADNGKNANNEGGSENTTDGKKARTVIGNNDDMTTNDTVVDRENVHYPKPTAGNSELSENGHMMHMQQLSSVQYIDAVNRIALMTEQSKIVVGSCTLNANDLQSIENCAWLNDKIMHAYMDLLARDRKRDATVYVLPSFLANKWQAGQYDDWLFKKVPFQRFAWLIMPLHVSGNHWAMLVANVNAATVGIADSLPSSSSTKLFLGQFRKYMATRAAVTGELGSWREKVYTLRPQQDGHSCGVLALMAAEAAINGVNVDAIDPQYQAYYRKYIRARLMFNCRPYDLAADTVCDMPLCNEPREKPTLWVQCDLCNRWCHNACVGLPTDGKYTMEDTFICYFCCRLDEK